MTEEIYDIVDEEDNVIGQAGREELREKNLLHRGATTIIKNSKGEILIHKRTMTKRLYPGLYDFCFGGGVDSGETYEEAAKRELEEEAGIKDVKLKFLFKHRYDTFPRTFIHIYECVYEGPFNFAKDEVEKAFFVELEELKKMMTKEKFCPDSHEIFEKYLEIQK